MFFGLFSSVETKMRSNAANWLELADKVYNYRRDLLTEAQRTTLTQASGSLRRQLSEKANAGKLKLSIEALENVLRSTGGAHYPKSGWTENVEFFLVAAIVILGVRSYFVQPFKIPTNSMWPSYNGMTPEVFRTKASEPGPAERVFRFVTLGARPRTLDAPVDGELFIPVAGSGERVQIPYREVKGRDWFVFPSKMKEYTLYVNQQPVTVTVPGDFDFEWVIRDALLPENSGRNPGGVDIAHALTKRSDLVVRTPDGRASLWKTGKHLHAGDRVLSFDILTGDQLFVDRVSYNFVRPSPGDGFVFHTGNIPVLSQGAGDQYYIKRLIGIPGDEIEIKEPAIYRNGKPIEGSKAFTKNAHREGHYAGYFNNIPGDLRYPDAQLFVGQKITVPANGYLAMGDNSGNSLDGRYWGFVPYKDVIGRPLNIYYPFTRRWGPAP